MASELRTFV